MYYTDQELKSQGTAIARRAIPAVDTIAHAVASVVGIVK